MSRWGTKVFAKANQPWCNERTPVGWFLIRGIHSSEWGLLQWLGFQRGPTPLAKLHFTFSAAVASIYFAQECLIQTDVILRNVFWKRREDRRPASFAEETSSCQVILGADRLAVTLYFGFHPGLKDTLGIQRSHRAHPGSFPLSSGALSVRLSCSPSGICDAWCTSEKRQQTFTVSRQPRRPSGFHGRQMSCCFEMRKTRSL